MYRKREAKFWTDQQLVWGVTRGVMKGFSFAAAHFAQKLFRGNGLALLTFRDGLQEHSFEFNVNFKRFF